MFPNAFIGKPEPPTRQELDLALGSTAAARWQSLLESLRADWGDLTEEWKSYSPQKAGWTLKLMHGQRAIVYVCPSERRFEAYFILGDKALEQARASGLPSPMLELMDSSPKYPEGTAVRFPVQNAADVKVVRQLAAIKRQTGSRAKRKATV